MEDFIINVITWELATWSVDKVRAILTANIQLSVLSSCLLPVKQLYKMRMHWLSILLLLILSSLPAQSDIGPNETKPKKAKLPQIKEENNVLVLKKSNFNKALKEIKYLLVDFCKYYLKPSVIFIGSKDHDCCSWHYVMLA